MGFLNRLCVPCLYLALEYLKIKLRQIAFPSSGSTIGMLRPLSGFEWCAGRAIIVCCWELGGDKVTGEGTVVAVSKSTVFVVIR
jgi:hypothetical protein